MYLCLLLIFTLWTQGFHIVPDIWITVIAKCIAKCIKELLYINTS